ncbi:MAG: phosphatidate cytidylyltransferase [Bacteroidia bacterium]
MKNFLHHILVLLIISLLPGCAVAGGIFKAGVVGGILLVLGIISLIVFLVAKSGKK